MLLRELPLRDAPTLSAENGWEALPDEERVFARPLLWNREREEIAFFSDEAISVYKYSPAIVSNLERSAKLTNQAYLWRWIPDPNKVEFGAVQPKLEPFYKYFDLDNLKDLFNDVVVSRIDDKLDTVLSDNGRPPVELLPALALYTAEYIRRHRGGTLSLQGNPLYQAIVLELPGGVIDCTFDVFVKYFDSPRPYSYVTIIESLLSASQ